MKRIGLFGGSFDPVHRGHIALARAATRELKLDRVVFVPARKSPLKRKPLSAPVHRRSMLRLALSGNPRFALSDFELKASGPSYTIRTLRYFRKKYPSIRLFLLMGGDAFLTFQQWKDWKRIAALCAIAVARRRGAAKISERFVRSLNAEVHILRSSIPAVSSTALRRRKFSVSSLPPGVGRYIQAHGLYS